MEDGNSGKGMESGRWRTEIAGGRYGEWQVEDGNSRRKGMESGRWRTEIAGRVWRLAGGGRK